MVKPSSNKTEQEQHKPNQASTEVGRTRDNIYEVIDTFDANTTYLLNTDSMLSRGCLQITGVPLKWIPHDRKGYNEFRRARSIHRDLELFTEANEPEDGQRHTFVLHKAAVKKVTE